MHTPYPSGSCPPLASCPAQAVGGPRPSGLRSLGVFLGLLFGVLALLSAGVRPARAASFLVTNLTDSGNGSLRATITSANANLNGGSTITFAPGLSGKITLTSALPALGKSMTITGPGASILAVDGARLYTPFSVNAGVTASLSGLTIQHGSDGGQGGGGVSNFGTLTLTGCTLTQNSAGQSGQYGGGVYNDGTLTLTGCTLTQNSAYFGGGVENDGTATLTGCTLTQNSASYGGGVYNNGTATLTGCTLTQTSAQAGGGVFNENNSTATLTGCTLTQNSADFGGGVENLGTLTLTDDILHGDTANVGGNEIYNYGSTSATYCDIQQSGYAGSNGNLSADPLFVSSAAPYDLHLKAGSPCIHVGNPQLAGTLDHDGNLYAAPNPSLGAYEYGFYTVTNTADSASPIPAGSLRAAITYANLNAGTVIPFAPLLSGTILLGSALPALAMDMTILGPGASVIAVDGQNAVRPFVILAGVALSGLTIQNGNARLGNGGGIYNTGTLTLTGCTLAGNRASTAGGVYNGGTLTLTGCTLAGNSAQNSGGGVENIGALTLTGCTLTQNSALDGGGVFNNGSVTLTRCALAGNSGGYGGGVENESGTMTLIGCTLTGNSTPNGFGGGIYNYNGTVMLAGCTLTGNSANNGGGVYNLGNSTVTLTNDILYGDTAPIGNEINGPASAAYCDIQQSGFAGSGGNLSADPRLAPLGSYGGPTQTCALLPGSPCLGAGTNAGLTADQRGVPIPQNGRYDIGAFESQGFTVSGGSGSGGTGGSGQAAPVGTAFAQSLTATVTANAGSEPVAGGVLTFTGPSSGASATFSPDPAPIGSTGIASVTATANGVAGGPYPVIADTGAGSAVYFLTNFSPSTAPAITLQPRDVTVTAGGMATFSASASGNPTPTVQWQVSTDGGLFANVSGATGTTLTLTSVTAAQNGSKYRAVFTNGAGTVTTSAATLTVIAPPTANAQAVAVAFNTVKAVTLTGSDPNSPPLSLTYAVLSSPTHGTLSGFNASTGAITYTPAVGYHGADSFTFTVNNGPSTSPPATVTLTVAAGTPTANAQSVSTRQGTAVGLTLTGSDPDVPALSLTYAVATGPAHGTLTGTVPSLTYTPAVGYFGADSFTFTVSNGTNTSPPATVTLTVAQGAAADVTAQITLTRGGFRYVRATGHYLQPVTLANTGAALADPLSLVLDGLTGATLVGASGTTSATLPAGSPYVTLPPGGLAAGASVTVTLEFTAQPSGYTLRVLAGPGAR